MRSWQLQDAKARFSEVVKAAESDGPQEVTVRGEAAAVLMSKTDHDRLTRRKESFVQFMRSSPLVGIRLNIKR